MRNSPNSRMNLAIVGSVGIPANYGGFETLVEQLVGSVGEKFKPHVYCSGKRYKDRRDEYCGAKLHYVEIDANGMSSFFYDIRSMVHASRYADIILVLGVSGCIFLPILRLFTRARIVVNVDGIEWKRDKWNRVAKWFLEYSEGVGARFSDAVIADNLEIKRYLDNRYGVEAACIAYGGDHTTGCDFDARDAAIYQFLGSQYAVKVCRVEPENNVHMILEAFASSANFPLVIIGNWAASGYGRNLRSKYSNFGHLHLLDPIYDPLPLNKIRCNASVYVHGHSAGGTNPSLVEAMWLGLPVFAFDVGYNRETTGDQAYYFDSTESLESLINECGLAQREKLASTMRRIARERYKWEAISAEYMTLLLDKQ